MGKTIRELAEELNLSKSGIRKYLSASFRARYMAKNAHLKRTVYILKTRVCSQIIFS